MLGSIPTKWRDDLCLGTHVLPLRASASLNTMPVHSKLRQKAPPPRGTQSLLPSTSKIMLRPWGGEQLVLTLPAVRQRCSGIFSFLISNACNIYLVSLVRVWFSSLLPSLFSLSLLVFLYTPSSKPGWGVGKEASIPNIAAPSICGLRRPSLPPGRDARLAGPGQEGNFQGKLHNPVGSGCTGGARISGLY